MPSAASLKDFHKLLEKASAQNALAFSQFQQATITTNQTLSAFGRENRKPESAFTQNSGHLRFFEVWRTVTAA